MTQLPSKMASEIPQRCVESSSKIDARNFGTFPEIWATPSPVESCNFSGSLAKGGSSGNKSIIIYFGPELSRILDRPWRSKVDRISEKLSAQGRGPNELLPLSSPSFNKCVHRKGLTCSVSGKTQFEWVSAHCGTCVFSVSAVTRSCQE